MRRNNNLYKLIRAFIGIFVAAFLCIFSKAECYADNVVVVIDPGHGGSNLGGNTDEYIEQELTIQVAKYMAERLEQYDGITVYLTHDEIGEKDLTREERATIAAEHNADFLFSLHFNMSENHNLYGAEVWTSAFGTYYQRGQEFGHIVMDGLHGDLDFFDRGVKTKLGKDGDDYYGIILYAQKKNIPAVIIEHCHLDEPRDNYFLTETENPYKTFGYVDADAVAKYFRLSSAKLGVDYSDYQYEKIDIPTLPVGQDKTSPEFCTVNLEEVRNNTAIVSINAKDSDGSIQYYQYSTDGGNTFSMLYPWNNNPDAKEALDTEEIQAEIPLVTGIEAQLTVRAYNRYELYADSSLLTLPAGEEVVVVEEDDDEYDDYEEIVIDADKSKNKKTKKDKLTEKYKKKNISEDSKPVADELFLYMIGGLLLLALIVSTFIVIYVSNLRRRRRRRKRRRR